MSEERDIVERLSSDAMVFYEWQVDDGKTIREAAAEIRRLRAEVERLTLRWTDTPPSEPGLYCFGRSGDSQVLNVVASGHGPLIAQTHHLYTAYVYEFTNGQWSDKPIPEPEEPTE